MKLPIVLGLGLWFGFIVHPGSVQARSIVVPGDFDTIQEAIDFVTDGDVIELANGTFTGDGNRDLSYLGKAITIRSQGGAANCIIDVQGALNHNAFEFTSGEGPTSVLEGVTITGGNHNPGGGIRVDSSPVIRDCVITGNTAGGDDAGSGGGVACGDGAPYFVGCTISGNYAIDWDGISSGGGVTVGGGSPTFQNCEFLSNYTTGDVGWGGNVFCNFSYPTFLDCTINGGSAAKGAGVYYESTTATFTRCVIADNRATAGFPSGGGIYCGNSRATFTDCILIYNQSVRSGAAMLCENSSVSLAHCTLYGNIGNGFVSGIYLLGTSVATIENTIISFSDGLAVACNDENSGATLTCCDLYGNLNGYGDWVDCVAGQAGINGNISLDPLFCDAANRDFHIDANSPCRPSWNPKCGLIGALPVNCGSTPTKPMSWGRIKAAYR